MTLYLLVLNLLVLGIGIGVEQFAAHRAPALNELNAGKIRFWTQPDSYKPVASTPAASLAQTASPTAPTSLCLEISDLSQARYLEMKAVLKSADLDVGQCLYSFDKRLGWWVFWPPEYEAGQRDKVIKSVQAAGVKDFLPITQGAMAQSFSLGVFASEAQANLHRDTLRGKGLAKVDFGPRPSMGYGRLGCSPGDPAKLDRLKVALPAWVKPVDQPLCAPPGEPDSAKPPLR